MPHPDDVLSSWSGYDNKSDFGIALCHADQKRHLWTFVYDSETDKAILINMDISDTRAHPYYYTVTAELAIY